MQNNGDGTFVDRTAGRVLKMHHMGLKMIQVILITMDI